MATQVLQPLPVNENIFYIDPSEHFRPEGKNEENFRNYSLDSVSNSNILNRLQTFNTRLSSFCRMTTLLKECAKPTD